MRIECERCRQWVEVEAVRVWPAGIEIDCPACEGRFSVPGTPAAGARRAPEPPRGAMRCPKCDEAQADAPACRRCGLAADRFASFAAETDAWTPPAVEAAWADCVARWGDPEAHEALAQRVVEAGAFAHAARLYRLRLRERPGDEVAARQLERVRRMAEAAALAASPAAREGEGPEPYRGAVWLLVIFALLAVGGGFFALLTGGEGKAGPDDAGPDERMRGAREAPGDRGALPRPRGRSR